MRDSSWAGIQEMYEKGEISEDQINTFIAIRNLTDEEWLQIKKDYLEGNISKEEFEQIKQIREMPEDWTTLENGVKGIVYGGGTGVWEGVQWYLGGKLAGWTFKGSKLATSAVRVGVDTGFNALDTPYRSLLSTISTETTFEEAWASQGGWKSVLTSVGVGLIGSMFGEGFDEIKYRKKEGDIKVEVTKETLAVPEARAKKNWEIAEKINDYYNSPVDCPPEYITESGAVNWEKMHKDGVVPEGGAVPGTSHDVILKKGMEIDRYGSESGYFSAKAGESLGSRSIPQKVSSDPNVYVVTKEISPETLSEWINSLDDNTKKEIFKKLGEERLKNFYIPETGEFNFNVKESIAAPLEFPGYPEYSKPGGAIQYEMPFSFEDLLDSGFIIDSVGLTESDIRKRLVDRYISARLTMKKVSNSISDYIGGDENE